MLVQLAGIKLKYQVFGEGKPILFLHGFIGNSGGMAEIFEPVFEELGGWKRVYLDSPGNGESEAPDWIRSSEQVLDVVEQFIDRVIPEKDFLLVGYSAGAYLSLGLTYRRPEQIEGVMLLCPLVEPDESKRQIPTSELRKVDPEFLQSLDSDFREALLSGQTGVVVVQPRVFERMDRVYTPAHEVANTEFLNRIKEEGYSFSFDVLQVSFDKPSLILTGRQDSSVGYLDTWKIVSRFERASFAVLDAAGHGLPLDQEQSFGVLVKEWLERVECFGHDSKLGSA
jgi:pimeloyl-ACP methyl ester carboxylesterase